MTTIPAIASIDEGPDNERRRHPWLRWALLILCVAMAAMWVYAFLFASSKGVYRVDDAHWRSEAQTICMAANVERTQLADTSGGYISNPTVAQMRQRAALVNRSTDILQKMLDDVTAVPVASDRDRLLINTFAKYYEVIITDRRTYTAALSEGRMVPYEETSVDGGPVTNVVTDFTSGNNITACVPPGELAGTL